MAVIVFECDKSEQRVIQSLAVVCLCPVPGTLTYHKDAAGDFSMGEIMRRNWIKLYVDQCLRGTMFSEMENPAERFVWFGFLLLAGDSAYEGKITLTENMGYTDEQLGSMLKCDSEIIKSAKVKMVNHDKIKIFDNNIIQIVNWKKYQSEYQRQKPYREDEKLQGKATPESDKQIEKEIEIRKRKEKKEKEINIHIQQIIEHWNSKNIKNLEDRESKIKEKTIPKIIKWLKDYPLDEIIEAITNYDSILKSDKYFFSYKWQLCEFMDRGLTNFLSKNKPFENYLEDKKKSQTRQEREAEKIKKWAEDKAKQ